MRARVEELGMVSLSVSVLVLISDARIDLCFGIVGFLAKINTSVKIFCLICTGMVLLQFMLRKLYTSTVFDLKEA